MGQQLIQQMVGRFELENVVSSQQRWQPFLPVVMASFDFAFGLWGGRVAQGHAVEVQRGAELSEGIGCVSEEKGVVVHVESQGQAVGLENARQEVQVRRERFARVEPRAYVI